MEQHLIYLAIAFIVVLIIVLVMTFHRLNKLKLQLETSSASYSELWGKYLLIYDKYEKSTLILSEYEKTNVLQINKINELEEENNKTLDRLQEAHDYLDDKIVFINALNGRLQKAEAERDKLQSKLSRKGLGKKGRKKENVIFEQPIDDSQITEVEFEEQKYVDITSTEQLEQYIGCKFECVLAEEDEFITFSGKLISNGKVFILAFNGTSGWKLSKLEKELADNLYNKGWGVFDDDFGDTIKSLKILL